MKKVIIIVAILVTVAALVAFTVMHAQANAVTVETGTVVREDLNSIVSASGEIKPKTFVNIGANAFGKITKLYVKEGDRVKRGQLLAKIENVQPEADVQGQVANVSATGRDAVAAEAGLNSSIADLNRAKADEERTKLDYDRAEALLKAQLIAKSDYDTRKAAYDVAAAQTLQAQAHVAQARAQLDSARGHVAQARAGLTRASDALSKTVYTAPFDGVITNLPVREGETVVVGIQNSPGSTLMTLSDMSVITAEVQVDETDIVNVQTGEPADIEIDAVPDKVFHGHVTDIGDNALVRSTGVATSQTTSSAQEAKDFKVTITLDDPPENLRPGLSATAKITTAARKNVLAIPIQAVTVRKASELQHTSGAGAVHAAAPDTSAKDEDIQGVFRLKKSGRSYKVEFVPVKTGITGSTDIEVLSGLDQNDQIVTGSFKVLRSLKNDASVKIEKPAKR